MQVGDISSKFCCVGGGEMIADVFLDHSTYAEPPSRLAYSTHHNLDSADDRWILGLWEPVGFLSIAL